MYKNGEERPGPFYYMNDVNANLEGGRASLHIVHKVMLNACFQFQHLPTTQHVALFPGPLYWLLYTRFRCEGAWEQGYPQLIDWKILSYHHILCALMCKTLSSMIDWLLETRVHKNGWLEWVCVNPIEAYIAWSNCSKTRTPGHMLSDNGLCLCSMHSTCYYFKYWQ